MLLGINELLLGSAKSYLGVRSYRFGLARARTGHARSLVSTRKSELLSAVTGISTSKPLKVVVKTDQQFCAGKKANARNDSGHAKN